ncbi:MAG: hypothetical protein HYY10_00005 [Candidatus Liptonbacteria bacterium]|nr:hypothetical protein [Candidatus Liptonbacteria bacterium]
MKKKYYSQFIEKLHLVAKRAHWKRFYDDESDSLFWTKQPIPSDNRLAKVAKEITFYLDKGGEVNGFIIQPFRSNFVSHNEEMAGFVKIFTSEDKVPADKLKTAESLLFTTIQRDIYKDVAEAKYSLKDLSRFLVSASK